MTATPPFALDYALEMRRVLDDFERTLAEADAELAGIDAELGEVSRSSSTVRVSVTDDYGHIASSMVRRESVEYSLDPAASGTPRGISANILREPPGFGGSGQDRPSILMALPVGPSSIRYERIPASRVTFTQDAVVKESRGLRARRLTIGGSIGLDHRLGTDRHGAAIFASGEELFAELVGFLEAYWEAEAAQPGRYELVWRDFVDNVHLLVAPDRQSQDLNETRLTYWSYEIPFLAYGTAAPIPRSFTDGFFAPFRKAAQQASDMVDRATAYVQIARSTIEEAIGVLNEGLEPLRAVERLSEQLSIVGDTVRQTGVLARSAVQTVLSIGENAISAVTDLAGDIGVETSELSWYESSVGRIEDALDIAAEAYALAQLQSERDAEHTYELRVGDSLEGIAQRLYGDESLWPRIAELNGLAPPYIAAAKLHGVAVPGQRLRLPAPARGLGRGRDTFPDRAVSDPDEALFGRDFFRGEDGEWELGANGDDIRTVAGAGLIVQDISAIVQTQLGTNLAFPGFGIPAAVGLPGHRSAQALAAVQVREALMADDRVERVDGVKVFPDATALRIRADVVLRGNRPLAEPVEALISE